jgi:hypothetical protein
MMCFCLLLPSVLGVFINERNNKNFINVLIKYLVLTLFVNFCSLVVIYYCHAGSSVLLNNVYFNVSFSIKYILMGMIFSIILPWLYRQIKNNFNFKVNIKKNQNKRVK